MSISIYLVYTIDVFIQRVIQALQNHAIDYALIGGYAVALHGAVRGTVDIDIVVSLDKMIMRELESALHALGLEPLLPVSSDDVYAFREEYISRRNMKAWSFRNPSNPLEIVDVLITHDVNDIETVTKQAFGLEIKVISIPDLIAIKKQAGRPQDIEDITALEKLR